MPATMPPLKHLANRIAVLTAFPRVLILLASSTAVTGALGTETDGKPISGLDGKSATSIGTSTDQTGRHLFERETFGGNGRTCRTCHSVGTGTLSPQDAIRRFVRNPEDPLFLHDGSDDGKGNGVGRILSDATVLMTIPLAENVTLANAPTIRSVVIPRGIPTTLNTPALDPVLMQDGREPDLESQAASAIAEHAQGEVPTLEELRAIARFQMSEEFYSSPHMRRFAFGGPAPTLPRGNTPSERRGKRFFDNVPPDPAAGFKPGLCAHCHSGPLLNETNEFAEAFIGLPIPAGTRFSNVGVSEFNEANLPVREFIFNEGTPEEVRLRSPDPGRALITGIGDPMLDTTLEHVNSFKISALRGIRFTAPYFHDNSAKTLEDVAKHYAKFFDVISNGAIVLNEQDQRDMVAYMKLLN